MHARRQTARRIRSLHVIMDMMDMMAADDVKEHLGQLGNIGQTKTRCWLLPMQATSGALQGKRGGSK